MPVGFRKLDDLSMALIGSSVGRRGDIQARVFYMYSSVYAAAGFTLMAMVPYQRLDKMIRCCLGCLSACNARA